MQPSQINMVQKGIISMEQITMTTPLRIGTMVLKNRLVMTPMNTNYSDSNGCLTPQMEEYYVRRAKGGAGLIELEAVSVVPETRNHGVQPMLWDEKYVPAWSNLIERLQGYGAKVSIEIAHFGSEATLSPRVSSSAVSRFADAEIEVLSKERIKEVQEAFVRTAINAKMAGVDAITLHGAHGYLLAEFMSPVYNHRTDEYGGSLENRMRFVTELMAMLRKEFGPRFPIWIRYSVDEFVTGGRTLEESIEIAKILEAAGVSAIDLSAGIPNTYIFTNPPNGLGDTSCMLIEKAAAVKKVVNIPVICANTIRYPEEIKQILAEGKADLVGLARPLLADPDFPNKAIAGQDKDIRPCLSCQHCFRTLDSGRSLRCAVNPETGREYAYGPVRRQETRKVLVAGGGPSGMEVARIAALEGHEVTLCEETDSLGGSMIAASIPPNKEKIANLTKWYQGQLEKLNVEVLLNRKVDDELISEWKPDKVVMACGADYARRIEGSTNENVLTAVEALRRPEKVGKNIIIIGGGASGCESADYFAGEHVELKWIGKDGVSGPMLYERIEHPEIDASHQVIIVEMLPEVAGDMDDFNRDIMRITLKEKGVQVITGVRVLKIDSDSVCIAKADGTEQKLKMDTVILAAGLVPHEIDCGTEMLRVGDSMKPGRIGDATFSAYALARELFEE